MQPIEQLLTITAVSSINNGSVKANTDIIHEIATFAAGAFMKSPDINRDRFCSL